MGYKLFNFGALWLNDDIQHVPVQLGKDGDIPQYDNKSSIFIGAGSQTETIVWVKPDDINLLIADRILLGNVSWVDLEKNGFVKGRETIIHGQRFRCRLLRVGLKNDEPNEWDSILDETCDANFLWHCKRTAFWGIDTSDGQKSRSVICGFPSTRCRYNLYAKDRQKNIGFRPVLEPMGSFSDDDNCTLDGVGFRLSSIPGTDIFCPVLRPTLSTVFADVPDGQKVKMYTITENGHPIHPNEMFKNATNLTVTDRYFGDEYLVQWVISNGVAVASKPLLKNL